MVVLRGGDNEPQMEIEKIYTTAVGEVGVAQGPRGETAIKMIIAVFLLLLHDKMRSHKRIIIPIGRLMVLKP